ncbi:MAG: ion transporter, partial [Thiobacillus sp.]
VRALHSRAARARLCLAQQLTAGWCRETVLLWVNNGFLALFVIEVAIKVAAWGRAYFTHSTNLFDCSIAVGALATSFLPASTVLGVQAARLFRVLRLLRLARSVRDAAVARLTCGRLCCDTYQAARELTRQTIYTLAALAEGMLGERKVVVDALDVRAAAPRPLSLSLSHAHAPP